MDLHWLTRGELNALYVRFVLKWKPIGWWRGVYGGLTPCWINDRGECVDPSMGVPDTVASLGRHTVTQAILKTRT